MLPLPSRSRTSYRPPAIVWPVKSVFITRVSGLVSGIEPSGLPSQPRGQGFCFQMKPSSNDSSGDGSGVLAIAGRTSSNSRICGREANVVHNRESWVEDLPTTNIPANGTHRLLNRVNLPLMVAGVTAARQPNTIALSPNLNLPIRLGIESGRRPSQLRLEDRKLHNCASPEKCRFLESADVNTIMRGTFRTPRTDSDTCKS